MGSPEPVARLAYFNINVLFATDPPVVMRVVVAVITSMCAQSLLLLLWLRLLCLPALRLAPVSSLADSATSCPTPGAPAIP